MSGYCGGIVGDILVNGDVGWVGGWLLGYCDGFLRVGWDYWIDNDCIMFCFILFVMFVLFFVEVVICLCGYLLFVECFVLRVGLSLIDGLGVFVVEVIFECCKIGELCGEVILVCEVCCCVKGCECIYIVEVLEIWVVDVIFL